MWLPLTITAGTAAAERLQRQGRRGQDTAVDRHRAPRRHRPGAGRRDPGRARPKVAADQHDAALRPRGAAGSRSTQAAHTGSVIASTGPRRPLVPKLRLTAGSRAPEVVLEADDVVLLEVGTGLHLDDLDRDPAAVG